MVSLKGISKVYHGHQRVLDQVNLELKKGEFLYVVGGTGAGKSTLLRLLATEEAPTVGVVSLFGYSLNSVSPSTLRAIRRTIGYVPQDIRLLPDLTVFDNVALSLTLASRSSLSAAARMSVGEILEKIGLQEKRGKLASELSGGEAQRVAIARALVRKPELIIADEPSGAQDRDFTWALMDMILKCNVTGATVVVATHDREIVRRIRKRCAMLRKGQLQTEESALCIY